MRGQSGQRPGQVDDLVEPHAKRSHLPAVTTPLPSPRELTAASKTSPMRSGCALLATTMLALDKFITVGDNRAPHEFSFHQRYPPLADEGVAG
jgi:hypothetical protein